MKIEKAKRIIKYNLIVTLALCALIGFSIFSYKHLNKSSIEQREKILAEISEITAKTQEIERKTQENKKYMELWAKISEKRKSFAGVKVEDVNKIVKNIAEKYSINNAVLKINVPENYPPEVYSNETLSILFTTGEITFNAYHDVKAIQFADEFIESLHGYPIITKFEFNKEAEYAIKDYFDISSGKSNGAIKGKIAFSWYVYKDAPSGGSGQPQNNNAPKK